MAKNNMISIELLATAIQQINGAFDLIDQLLDGKVINLSPSDRQRYGSINEQNKLFILKAHSFYQAKGQLLPSYFDRVEYEKDFNARQVFENLEGRTNELYEKLRDTRTLLDYDSMRFSSQMYKQAKNMSESGVPGVDFWVAEMAQFFKRSRINLEAMAEEEDVDNTAEQED
ncbi:hypothetical protein [Saprospira grandis]|uniref:hypothetical protein n=1 Tax=Saprospira grandis TaxID=1008 RepID=UPI0022DD96F9|nr:hypothetical protein [Saprospira grandis]WBM73633.1 hypothetical protein OP864_11635 [Saprospira grandis]